MRRIIVGAAVAAALVLGTLGVAQAAPNPSGTGQPGASCGSAGATSAPAGFDTAGFAHAEEVYAGSPGTPSAQNGSPQAVSQYDVACYQLTSNGH
jgi:hypothetical protein